MKQLHEHWDFTPHRMASNRHLQTVLAVQLPYRYDLEQATQHRLALDDGDTVILHENAPRNGGDDAPCVLLLHGLTGSYLSTYMRRMAQKLVNEGYRVFRKDMRDCGAGVGLAQRPSHCGRWPDVVSALHFIAELYPEAATSIVGYSMGGTIVANMLAEAGEMRVANLERSFVVCPPIDLIHVEHHFRSSWGKLYNNFFVRNIWKQALDRWQQFPELAPEKIPARPKRLRDIDDMITAPTGGFSSAEDYYIKTSPRPKLSAIRQPLTIFYSEDDPVVPIAPLLECPRSSSVQLITTKHGGHLGFLGQGHGDPDARWLDWRIVEWLKQEAHTLVAGSGTNSFQVQTA